MIDNTNRGGPGHIDLWLRERVTRVFAEGKVVAGVQTVHHGSLQSSILIDATEFGDVIPLTPARFRSGNRIGASGPPVCTQDITYTMVIKKYPDGVPPELQMKNPPPGYDQWLAKWRLNLRKDGNPDNRTLPVNFAMHNAYRGMPDPWSVNYVSLESRAITKTSINWFNDFHVETDIYDRAKRQKYICDAKLKTLGNLYYFQHELGETEWSVANDQEYDTAYQREDNLCPNIPAEYKAIEYNMPQSAYIRESQRIIGKHKLIAPEIRRESQGGIGIHRFPSSIAVGDYADDLHGCNAEENLETDLDHKTDDPPGFRSGPFQVPFGALIPEEVDGMLAAEKNISVSRLANGAVRLQPITMLTGQASGALAALSIRQKLPPRRVDPTAVQIALLQAGNILASLPIRDMPMGTVPWQAAQFAVTLTWIDPDSEGNFHPKETISRGDAVTLLALAYNLISPAGVFGATPTAMQASYSDVPLYDRSAPAAEALHGLGVDFSCSVAPAKLCPSNKTSRAAFVETVQKLETKKQSTISAELLAASLPLEMEKPITREEAVVVLYSAVKHRNGY
jgi:hypothetical protein